MIPLAACLQAEPLDPDAVPHLIDLVTDNRAIALDDPAFPRGSHRYRVMINRLTNGFLDRNHVGEAVAVFVNLYGWQGAFDLGTTCIRHLGTWSGPNARRPEDNGVVFTRTTRIPEVQEAATILSATMVGRTSFSGPAEHMRAAEQAEEVSTQVMHDIAAWVDRFQEALDCHNEGDEPGIRAAFARAPGDWRTHPIVLIPGMIVLTTVTWDLGSKVRRRLT